MREVLLLSLYFSIFCLFVEGVLVFGKIKTRLDSCLFFSCVALLINNTGYLFELKAETEEAYITALQLSYLGRVWITFPLFLFAAELTHVRIPDIVTKIMAVIHVLIYGVIMSLRENSLFYTDTDFDTSGLFPVLHHGDGPVHHFFAQLQTVMLFIALYWIFAALRKEKSENGRKRLIIIFTAFLTEGILFLMQIGHALAITYSFDISIFGNLILTVAMFIGIFRYDLLEIVDIAREFVIDRLSEGVIAIDNEGRVRYYNEPMKLFFPDMDSHPESVVRDVKEAVLEGETITLNDRIYKPEENDLKNRGESLGKLYALVDVTALKEKEYKLKSDAAILEMAAKTMRERLLTAEEMVQQDRAMRHDRRHFEALLLSLLQDGETDEAKKCLEERLKDEPRSAARFCENATVNAAISHYAHIAEKKDIAVRASANIPFDPGADEMQLAIAISNLLENAIHACEELPVKERYIEIRAKYKEQLLLEISNPCREKVPLNGEGHPFSTEAGHGVGTKSVLAFVRESGSEIRYIADEHVFRVRMIIN